MMLFLAFNEIVGKETVKVLDSKNAKESKNESSNLIQKDKSYNFFIGVTASRFRDYTRLTVPIEGYSSYYQTEYYFTGFNASYRINNKIDIGLVYLAPWKAEIENASIMGFSFAYYKKEIKIGQAYDFFIKYYSIIDTCKSCYLILMVGKNYSTEVNIQKYLPSPLLDFDESRITSITLDTLSPNSVQIFQKSKAAYTIGFGKSSWDEGDKFYIDWNIGLRIREFNNPDILINSNYFRPNFGQTLSVLEVMLLREMVKNEIDDRRHWKGMQYFTFSAGLAF